ncbi:MAG: four helix bundle protein [Eudoraea sp.]|nr:four helix bundle protein [Eudoraea sp.]
MYRSRVYDLEQRTYRFARDCRLFIRELPKTLSNLEDGKQLIKASGSVGANYIEANEKLGGKDLTMRLRIARKEARESHYWLTLLKDLNSKYEKKASELMNEAFELKKILSAIIIKTSKT